MTLFEFFVSASFIVAFWTLKSHNDALQIHNKVLQDLVKK